MKSIQALSTFSIPTIEPRHAYTYQTPLPTNQWQRKSVTATPSDDWPQGLTLHARLGATDTEQKEAIFLDMVNTGPEPIPGRFVECTIELSEVTATFTPLEKGQAARAIANLVTGGTSPHADDEILGTIAMVFQRLLQTQEEREAARTQNETLKNNSLRDTAAAIDELCDIARDATIHLERIARAAEKLADNQIASTLFPKGT